MVYDTIILGDIMARYGFKVYLKDGDTKTVYFSALEKASLQEMDSFVLEQGIFALENKLAEELTVLPQEIEKVKILQVRKQTEFSLCIGNPYLNPILMEIKNSHKIPTTHPVYQDMKKYLFQNLWSENYRYFLDEIYSYQNQFHSLLERYCLTYHQYSEGAEDDRYQKELEEDILENLKNYKNYRGLCICRKKQEEKAMQTRFSHLKISSQIATTPYHLSSSSSYSFLSTEEKVSHYNQKHDEYLSPDEYQMMQGEDEPYQYRSNS